MVCQLAYIPEQPGACGRTRTYEGPSGPPDLQSGAFATRRTHADSFESVLQKRMKAERTLCPNTLRGTLLLRMAISRTLAKHRDRHPEGSLPSSLANR